MRLILVFDENFDFLEDDIVLGYKKPKNVSEECFVKVNQSPENYDIASIEKVKNQYLTFLKTDFSKSVFESTFCNFSKNWIFPVFGWTNLIDKSLESNNIDEIIISGYSQYNFTPLYEAEGEFNKRFFYKIYDSIPKVLFRYLKSKHSKVIIVNKKLKLKACFRKFIRRYILLLLKFIFFLIRKFKVDLSNFLKKSTKKTLPYKNKNIFFSRGIAHTQYVQEYLNEYKNDSVLYLSEGITSNNLNKKLVETNAKYIFIDNDNYSSYKTIIISFFKILIEIFKRKKIKIPLNQFIEINFGDVFVEMCVSYYDALLYKENVNRFIQKNNINSKLITMEMYSPFAYVIGELGLNHKIKTYQLQSASLELKKFPPFFFCNKFLFKSEKTALDFEKLYPNYKNQIDFYGNLNNLEKGRAVINELPKNVIYFSQPNYEEEAEGALIIELMRLKNIKKFNLIIKPHPRDNSKKFNKYKGIKTIENSIVLSEYIKDFDLAIVRNSSVATDLFLEGIPIIFCLLTERSQNTKIDYIYQDYFGTIKNVYDLLNVLNNYKLLLNDYTKYRKKYFNDSNFLKDMHFFHKRILNEK